MDDPLYLQINICSLGLDITKIYPISTQFMSTEESIDYCNTSWYTPMIFLLEKSTNVNSHSVISLQYDIFGCHNVIFFSSNSVLCDQIHTKI